MNPEGISPQRRRERKDSFPLKEKLFFFFSAPRSKRAVLFLLAAVLPSFAAENTPLTEADDSIVEVIATCQEFDPRLPWRKNSPQVRQGMGIVVEENKILTAESIVRNHTLVEIRRARSGTKMEAKVLTADEQVNAALLKISDTNALNQFKSVSIAGKVRRNDKVIILKMDESGQFQSNEGQVVEITSSPQGLTLKVLTDMSVEKAGTPVFLGNNLAGIVTDYDKAARSCLALSATTLNKFLTEANAGSYAGMAWAGLIWEPLLDPAKQKYLGLDKKEGGVLVINTLPGSGAAEVLQPEDVILEWDGHKLDELGYYSDSEFGRLMFTWLVNGRRTPGENASVTILHNQEKQTIDVPLRRRLDREQIIPENTAGIQAEYLADGGMILRELSGDYLHSMGHDWAMRTNPRLVHYYFNPWQFSKKAGEHIVILSCVLPDRINIGYHELRNEIVTAVNGRPVRNLADVFSSVELSGGLKRITLMGHGVDLVLDEKEMPAANKRISENYRIPSLRYQRSPAGKGADH